MSGTVSLNSLALPALGTASIAVLDAPAASPAGGYAVTLDALSGLIGSYTLVFDLYVGSDSDWSYNSLFQTDLSNGSDGEFFMLRSGDTFGIGISGLYAGAFSLDDWHRLVVTSEIGEDGSNLLSGYVDGTYIGTLPLNDDRFLLDADNGFYILADNDGETVAEQLATFAVLPVTLDGAAVAALGGVDAAGTGIAADIAGAVEFTFAGGDLAATTGAGTMTARSAAEAGTVTTAAAAGIEEPDRLVLQFDAVDASGGYLVDAGLAADATSFTLVYDLLIPAGQSGYGGLAQFSTDNGNDGDLFLRGDGSFGIGISGQYDGAVASDTWVRVAFTVADQGDGTSVLSKYIDGTLVGTQSVDTARFTVDAEGFLILTDEDGETFSGYLANFAFADTALSAADMAALGGATAEAIPASAFGTATTAIFDFAEGLTDGSATAGGATLTDLSYAAVEVLNEITHQLVTEGEVVTIDLSEIFAGEGLSYAVETSGEGSLSWSLEDGALTVTGDSLGFDDFTVTATDIYGNTASDSFRLRVAGENAYTLVVYPDTQDYSGAEENNVIAAMNQWVADNAAGLGITAVLHVGDVTGSNTLSQWQNVSEAYEILEEAGIAYTFVPGNHDQATGGSANDHSSNIDAYFDTERYFAQDEGGVYDGDTSISNNYKLFTAPDGTEWIVVSVEFGARDDVLRWADEVLTEYADRRAIVMTHHYTNMADIAGPRSGAIYAEGTGKNYGMSDSVESVNDGRDMWSELVSKHANVSFVFSGHVFGDGAETIVQYGESGNAVAQMLVNYQNGVAVETQTDGDTAIGGNGGNGAMRLVVIDPDNDAVYTETYYEELGEYMTGARGDAEPSRDGSGSSDGGSEVVIQEVSFGTVAALGFPALPDGDTASGIVATPQFDASNGLLVDPGFAPAGGGSKYLNYTLVWDMYLPEELGLISILQVDLTNLSDGDLWLQGGSDNGLFGTSGQDDGPFETGKWARVTAVFTATDEYGSSYRLDKYVDGVLVGTQILSGDSYIVQAGGFIVFGDNGSETPAGSALSAFAFVETSLTAAEVAAMGTVDADGPFEALPSGVNGVQFDFENGDFTPSLGTGTMTQDLSAGQSDDLDLTGAYREGQETLTGIGIETPEIQFHAVAGDNQTVDLGTTGTVTLDGSASVDYLDQVVSAVWTDADGNVVAETLVAEIEGKGGVQHYTLTLTDADGTVSTDTVLVAGIDADTLVFDGFDDGNLEGWTVQSGLWVAAGAVNSGTGTAAGHLQANTSGDAGVIVYTGAGLAAWDNYTVSAEIENENDQAMGLLAGVQADGSAYALEFDVANSRIRLLKIVDGETTVLAQQDTLPAWDIKFVAELSIDNGVLMAAADGQVLFGGAVHDTGTALTGSVGVFHNGTFRADIDYVSVRTGSLIADAGATQRVLDTDGDGVVTVTLDAPEGGVWSENGVQIGAGDVTVDLAVGSHLLKLDLTQGGESDSDTTVIEVIAAEDILLVEDFEDGTGAFTFVDEGELGQAADWQVVDGALVQSANRYSYQLMGSGDTVPSSWWALDWSPLGDGFHALRKGTYALYDEAAAYAWEDYSVAVDFTAPSGGAVGLVFHYQDADNYYKLELDRAGGTSQLISVVGGIENMEWQGSPDYDVSGTNSLRLDIVDGRISVWLDGFLVFEPIEIHTIAAGTFGLYNWGAPDTSYDNVEVVRLYGEVAGETDPEVQIGTDAAETLTGTAGEDTILGEGGNDTVTGGTGADMLFGGAGDDLVQGEEDADTIDGGAGADRIEGAQGGDVLIGGAGQDVILGGLGDDSVLAGEGGDRVRGGLGEDVILGEDGADRLSGEAGDDLIRGGQGRDRLDGGDGADTLGGGLGADTLAGGAGDDLLTGGLGADRFVFAPGGGSDTVADFDAATDRLDLTGFGLAGLGDLVITATGGDLVIDLSGPGAAGDAVILRGIEAGALTEDAFLF